MTLFEFQLLDMSRQIDYIYQEGIYIGKRKAGPESLLLYQVDTFYAELYYRAYRRHVRRIRCFSSTLLIEPYLGQVDVAEVVQHG